MDFPLTGLYSKKIIYLQEYDHTTNERVDFPLAGLGCNEISYFLEPNHSIDVVLRCEKHSKVDCILAETSPTKIGYILQHDQWMDFPLLEVVPKRIGYLLDPYRTMEIVLGM